MHSVVSLHICCYPPVAPEGCHPLARLPSHLSGLPTVGNFWTARLPAAPHRMPGIARDMMSMCRGIGRSQKTCSKQAYNMYRSQVHKCMMLYVQSSW